ncbi:MAG: 30S ribosomal protein S11 [Candidatus Stahlbacteria bacterium]|nr:30S ribosomal protein S11 [Candidatus Stahlbacteria bacterium]
MVTQRKKPKKVSVSGIAHIYATFNNTIVTITDISGNCVTWASSGAVGFKGTKKGTPYAAGICARKCAQGAVNLGMRSIEIWLKGPGAGRDSAVRSLKASGLRITLVKDITPLPHNGCRPPKQRRV